MQLTVTQLIRRMRLNQPFVIERFGGGRVTEPQTVFEANLSEELLNSKVKDFYISEMNYGSELGRLFIKI